MTAESVSAKTWWGEGVTSFFTITLSIVTLLTGLTCLNAGASEVFLYDLKWLGIKAGEARLEFIEEGNTVRVATRAESSAWVSVFYHVDDRAESVMDKVWSGDGKGRWFSKIYRLRIQEGRHSRDKEVMFDTANGNAVFIDHIKNEKEAFLIPPGTYDPLSAFYLIRKQAIQLNNHLYTRIFDSKKVWDVKVEVLGREEIETKAGRFNTIIIKPHLKSEGIFLRKGGIRIYLTDDDRHIPVLLRTKVLVGSVDAELTGITSY